MGTFISIYIIIGLFYMIWMNYKHPYTEYLRESGKGDMGLFEFTFSCVTLLVMCVLMWPLILYVGLKKFVKGIK